MSYIVVHDYVLKITDMKKNMYRNGYASMYCLKTLIVYAHYGVYEITCKCMKWVISVFQRINQEYEMAYVNES